MRRIGSAEVTGPIPVISFFLNCGRLACSASADFYQGFSHFYRREFFMEAKINVEYPVIDVLPPGKTLNVYGRKRLEGEGYSPFLWDS